MEILDIGYTYIVTWSDLKHLALFDCKLEIFYICIAFHSNLETDYDPEYLDSKLEMQYLLSGKFQKENSYIFGKLINQISL